MTAAISHVVAGAVGGLVAVATLLLVFILYLKVKG